MKERNKSINIRTFAGMPAWISGMMWCLLLLSGCSKDDFAVDEVYPDVNGIVFESTVGSQEDLTTRAAQYNISSEFYQCDFHLHIEGDNNKGEHRSETAPYMIPSGYSGIVIPKDMENGLNWFSRANAHNFWGWTVPYDRDYEFSESDLTDGIKVEFKDTDIQELNNNSTYTFKSGSWENGAILEQMLGGKSGPYVYDVNGMYIPLTFRHMVSKIILRTFNIVDNVAGTGNTNQRGEITIYGLPKEGTFHICPVNDDGTPRFPYIAMPEDWDYDQTQGQKFVISNYSKNLKWEGKTSWTSSTTPKDCWYICPEVDLSRLSFKIEIYEYNATDGEWQLSQSHGVNGAYYGDFSNVTFTRNNSNYDDPAGGDETILHAGEYLTLNFNIQERGNATAQGNITGWYSYPSSTDRTGNSHVHQGLYTNDDVRDFNDIMSSGDPESMEDYYNMFGSARDTGEDLEGEYPDYEELYDKELKVFDLYDDVGSASYHNSTSSSSTTTKVSNLNTGDDYMLDGNGHTINCTSTSMKVGHVRNVYLRVYYYTSTSSNITEKIVYIDKMGNIWLVDPETFEETPTPYNINDPNKCPVTLNLSTGAVT